MSGGYRVDLTAVELTALLSLAELGADSYIGREPKGETVRRLDRVDKAVIDELARKLTAALDKPIPPV
jgi:hypothetical protein